MEGLRGADTEPLESPKKDPGGRFLDLLDRRDGDGPEPAGEVEPSENLLEALRDFGTRDIETLPVESGQGPAERLVGLLMRSDVMRRYRQEMLRR